MKQIYNSVYFSWAILAIPSIPMISGIVNGVELERLLHPTGEFAARLMILAMMITPLGFVFKNSKIVRSLRLRRRAIGVAAFCYALLHTILYLVDLQSLEKALKEFWELGIWTGWVAFAIFLPLAITSNDTMVRKLRHRWKYLQRFVYLAAVFTLLHWVYVHNNVGPALVHFLPLAGLQLYRIYLYFWSDELVASN